MRLPELEDWRHRYSHRTEGIIQAEQNLHLNMDYHFSPNPALPCNGRQNTTSSLATQDGISLKLNDGCD